MALLQRFIYVNGTVNELLVTIEPWAEQFDVRPGQRVEILVSSESTVEPVEFEQLPTGLVIYGQEGCVISLSTDGDELLPSVQK
jgi:hypothetical protein